jgi:hypothetical protein
MAGGGGNPGAFAWGEPTLIAPGSNTNPQVATNTARQTMVAWEAAADGPDTIDYVRFGRDAGWGSPSTVPSTFLNSYAPVNVRVAMHSSGTAMVAWLHGDRALSNRHTPGAGWEEQARFDIRYLAFFIAEIAMDAGGNVVTALAQGGNAVGNHFSAESGWGDAVYIDAGGGAIVRITHVAVNPSGRAHAVWIDGPGLGPKFEGVYTAELGSNGVWTAPTKIEEDVDPHSYTPRVAVDDARNVLVAWQRSDGERERIWTNSLRPGSAWGTATAVEGPETGDARGPRVVLSPDGNGIVVWRQAGDSGDDVVAAPYAPDTGFSPAVILGSGPAPTEEIAEVAIDARGRCLVVWVDDTMVMADYFTPELGWRGATPIGESESGEPTTPHVAISSDGFGVAVWADVEGIWANRFE